MVHRHTLILRKCMYTQHPHIHAHRIPFHSIETEMKIAGKNDVHRILIILETKLLTL